MQDLTLKEMPESDLDDMLNTSMQQLSQSFVEQVKKSNIQRKQVTHLLTVKETFIALLKGYCQLSILMMPKAFLNGGWGASAIFMACSGFINLVTTSKLIDAGLAT